MIIGLKIAHLRLIFNDVLQVMIVEFSRKLGSQAIAGSVTLMPGKESSFCLIPVGMSEYSNGDGLNGKYQLFVESEGANECT